MSIAPAALRKEGETIDQYLIRLGSSLSLYDLTWSKVAELMNSQPEIEDEYSESKYRKDYAAYERWLKVITEKVTNSDDYLSEIKDASLNLQKERIKLQSEKIEYNKMIREQSRAELLEEKIEQAILTRPTVQVPSIFVKSNNSKQDFLMPIADSHNGVEFIVRGWNGEVLNEYSPDILKKRMWTLLEEYVRINDTYKINHVHLPNLGDSIDGILRMSQLQSLKLGVIDSCIDYSEFITQWLNELSKYSKIDYYSLQGNHDELRLLSGKRGDFPHENTERWINHYLKVSLRDNDNVKVHGNSYFLYIDILGTKVLGVHGENEKNLEHSVKDYSLTYGKRVDLLISGHLHSAHEKTIGMNGMKDIEYVQCPSLVGIDDYSLKLKKTSNAGVKLMIIEEELGRTITHNIRLK